MGLVEYSDSESDSETVAQPAPKPTLTISSTAGAKKPFQRIVDKSKPGKIVVSLPGAASPADPQASSSSSSSSSSSTDQPPPKRARVGGGGGAFSGFNALLPPPKNVGRPAATSSSNDKTTPRPGVNLKTGATRAFSRSTDDDNSDHPAGAQGNASSEPAIPEQKPADEVKLVGKPMMFKPLSVSRKPQKKPIAVPRATTTAATSKPTAPQHKPDQETPLIPETITTTTRTQPQQSDEPPKKKKQKMSLFSISQESDLTTPEQDHSAAYEPVFPTTDPISTQEAFAAYDAQFTQPPELSQRQYQQQYHGSQTAFPQRSTANSLDTIASDLNLSAAARRELFGRRGAPDPTASASRVINFNTDAEYAANEEYRNSGEAQPTFNPVRAIAPGKHNLKQLVNQVQNNRDALEESFAKGHRNRSEAGAKYGWR